jgi:hypothetical protein
MLVGLVLVGCSGGDEVALDSETQAVAVPSGSVIATLKFPNGNIVDFLDFASEGGVLITERGQAFVDPVYAGVAGETLTQAWTRLAPDKAVPANLAALQDRLNLQTVQTDAAPSKLAKPSDAFGATGEVANKAACGNGCCDFTWLSSQIQCQAADFDYQYFLMDFGYSWIYADDIIEYSGFVCSGVGTSNYSIKIGNKTTVYPVPENSWRTHGWFAAWSWLTCQGYCGKNMKSFVNNIDNQHVHAYCAKGLFD